MTGVLDGKVAWVTGAANGLGRDIARALHAAGAAVALTSRTPGPLETLAGELADRVLAVPGDVADPAFAAAAVADVSDELGPLDVLVTMAGINPTVRASEDLDVEQWREVVDVNLSGTFWTCQAAARSMLARGAGSIVTVSSVHGSTGVARMAAYGASKGGVENLTRSLAVEWADRGVRVNCLAPGYFRTAMTAEYLDSRHGRRVLEGTPLGRPGDGEEITGIAVFLASDASSYMTGAVVAVDGGWTAR